MAYTYKVKKPCKVCGKLFTPCSDCENDKTAFHWRTVACSIECGRKYLAMVLEARTYDNVKDSIGNSVSVDNTIDVQEDMHEATTVKKRKYTKSKNATKEQIKVDDNLIKENERIG